MEFLFYVLAAACVASSLGVVVCKNPIYSALCLVSHLILVAGLYAQLHAHFLMAAQVVVYAGAIMVLVIFVLMLLNLKTETKIRAQYLLVGSAVLLAVVFFGGMVPYLTAAFHEPMNSVPVEGTVANVGTALYTKELFPFEAASVLILVSLVGAVTLAKRSYKRRTV